MKKIIIILIGSLVLVPGLIFGNSLTFKIGYFIPRAASDLWKIEFENMSFTKSNYQNTTFSVAYEYFLTRRLSLVFGLDSYSKNKAGFYKDYVGRSYTEGDFAFPLDYQGDDIAHGFNISITPIQASLKITPAGRRARLIPYVGGGVGLYVWTVRLQGYIVDFDDIWYYEDPSAGDVEIYGISFRDARENNKLSFGYHVFGGLMFPIGNKLTLEAEFKYNKATGKFSDIFEGFEPFDLSGYQISLGLNYWF